jgi:hypothetical protein
MYYTKSIKKILSFFTEAENIPVDKNQQIDPTQQQDASVVPVVPLTPGAPPTLATSKRVTKIQISPDPTKEGSDEKILAKFRSNKSSTIPTKSATTPITQNKETPEDETSTQDGNEDNKEKLINKEETPVEDNTTEGKKAQFSKRVDKHINDINGKNKDSSIYKHERKLKQDKRFKEFTGSTERDHKKAIGKSVNKDYYKKLDKKLGY